ncbi:MAG: hypothetical protein JJT89_00540 [Nitriliruptoraceae bacterium]|nr:hypothetical protein [Nitriliruptoraceae bacterium]
MQRATSPAGRGSRNRQRAAERPSQDTSPLGRGLSTDHLKPAAVEAFRTGDPVRVCDATRCVDVVPDVVLFELVANGGAVRPSWLRIRSTVQFPGRVAHVYDAGEVRP